MNKNSQYENFDKTMRTLVSVPHSEIKAKLEAEKRQKKKKRKSKASALDHVSSGDEA